MIVQRTINNIRLESPPYHKSDVSTCEIYDIGSVLTLKLSTVIAYLMFHFQQ